MLKAIIFDCFGVIYPQASGEFFKKHKVLFQGHLEVMDKLNLKIDLGEISRTEFFAGLEKVTGISAKTIRDEIDSQLNVDQDLIELIKKLKTKYKIGLLSNAGKEEIDIIYRDKISNLFEGMTISYEANSVKPDAKIFLVCLKRLGIKPNEAIFIDDSITNIEAAKNIGLQTIDYPKFGAIPKELNELATF